MKKIDKSIQDGTNTIYAETTNIDEIEYANVKKGFFDNIIFFMPGYLYRYWSILSMFCQPQLFYSTSLVWQKKSGHPRRWPE